MTSKSAQRQSWKMLDDASELFDDGDAPVREPITLRMSSLNTTAELAVPVLVVDDPTSPKR